MKNSMPFPVAFLAVVAVAACCLVALESGREVVGAESAAVEDSEESRLALAERCVKCAPTEIVAEMACGRIATVRGDIPNEKREEFIKAMLAALDLEKMTATRTEIMAKHFTAEELNALADFYESPHGRTAWRKLGEYVQDMQAENRSRMIEAEAKARQELGLPAVAQ